MGRFDWADDDSSDRSNSFTRMSSFSNHPSIQMIKNKYQNFFNIKFEPVSAYQVIKFNDEIKCNKRLSRDLKRRNCKMNNKINSFMSTDTFPHEWKIIMMKVTIDQLAFYL